MNTHLIFYAFLMLLGTFISAVAQVALKKAAMREYESHIREYLNPTVIIAYIVFFAASLLGVLAYKGVPLSMGPILEASSYIYVTIFGCTIFRERVTIKKIIALIIILSGIMIFSLG